MGWQPFNYKNHRKRKMGRWSVHYPTLKGILDDDNKNRLFEYKTKKNENELR